METCLKVPFIFQNRKPFIISGILIYFKFPSKRVVIARHPLSPQKGTFTLNDAKSGRFFERVISRRHDEAIS